MDKLEYLQIMIDAVRNNQDCVLETIMYDNAIIARLLPIEAYYEDEEEEDD